MRMPGRVAAATAVAAVMVVSFAAPPAVARTAPMVSLSPRQRPRLSRPARPAHPLRRHRPQGAYRWGCTPSARTSVPAWEIKVTIEAPSWQGEVKGGYMCWVECEDRGAAVIAFNDRKYFPYRNPCRWSLTGPNAPVTTASELVAILARQELRDSIDSRGHQRGWSLREEGHPPHGGR